MHRSVFWSVRGWLAVAFLLLINPDHLWAQRNLKDIPDPDPELERQTFQVAEGFEVTLFAADPAIAKPIQMNFDARGRLWIASSSIYPHIKPGEEANDRILIVEDTDGNGQADRTTVFADGLLIPTGVEPGDGGAYVANSTELVHLRDTDGDGKADTRRVMLSGFGTEDTHHILHTLRWGMDGQLYFNQSIYIHSHIETPHGVRRLGGGGIWQFRPETMRLEILCRGFVNPWGHHFDDFGQSFATDGAYGEGINYVFPGSVFVTAPGAARILKGLNPGSPKHCGMEILTGTHLPEDWRGSIITNDFRGHRVCRFVISDDGSGYASREQTELIKSSHVAFRPIDVKMGPDGAIYIADWYNPIIQHGEVDFRDPRRDHVHGRIWRVTAKGRPLVKLPPLVGVEVEALLEALNSPEAFVRHHARLQLKERGATAVLPKLNAWVSRLDAQAPQYEQQRLEALWVYQALNAVQPDILESLLHARDGRIRAAAVRVVSQWHDRLANPLASLAVAVNDDHPRVRLEAVRALALLATPRAAELAMQALDRPVDRFLDFALWQTARDLQGQWLPALQAGDIDFDGNERHLTFALQSIGSPAVVAPLVNLLKEGKLPPGREEGALTLIAALGGPDELRLIFDLTLADNTQADIGRRVRLLNVLAEAARRRDVKPAGDLAPLSQLISASDDSLRAAAARSAGLWKLESLRPQLDRLAQQSSNNPTLLQAALEGLTALGGERSRDTFLELTNAKRPEIVRVHAVAALAALDLPMAATQAVGILNEIPPGDLATPVYDAFLQRKQGPEALQRALADVTLPADTAKIGVRAARISGRDLPALIEALTKAGRLTTGPRTLPPEELATLVAAVQQQGDPQRGEAVFRRNDQSCLKCHAISGAGGQVGPDLASIGASAQIDYLVDSLLLPNKAVKENYHSVVVATTEGKVMSGIKVRQTESELVLRNSEDREVVIPVADIEDQAPAGSIMPEGLTDPLTRAELLDLVRFLSELGKPGPFAAGKARLVRRWQVLDSAHPALPQLREAPVDTLVRDTRLPWNSVYSRVSGDLPVTAVPMLPTNGGAPKRLVRCQLDVTTAGPVRLAFSGAVPVQGWHDGQPIDVHPDTTLDLPQGLRTLTFALPNPPATGDTASLRCELLDAPNSPAQAQFVGGK